MAVTDEIMSKAGDLELFLNWKQRLKQLTPIGYRYAKGEPRRYYTDGNGRYYYRTVTEAEMHKRE